MQPSIFTRIIRNEIPSHKIYEDQHTYAFLDIHPAREGHVLVVSKEQVDRVEDLPESDYTALFAAVHKVMQRLVQVYGPGYRACVKIMGFDVPHAHVQVLPCRTAEDYSAPQDMDAEPDQVALAEVAKKLAF